MSENNKTIVDTLQSMTVGESLDFPAEQSPTVRSTASTYGFKWNRTYTTKTNREQRIITVTRIN